MGKISLKVCVSGGWAGGNLEDPGALYENTANMLSSSLYASLISFGGSCREQEGHLLFSGPPGPGRAPHLAAQLRQARRTPDLREPRGHSPECRAPDLSPKASNGNQNYRSRRACSAEMGGQTPRPSLESCRQATGSKGLTLSLLPVPAEKLPASCLPAAGEAAGLLCAGVKPVWLKHR